MNRHNAGKNRVPLSRRVALGGLFSALALVVLLAGGIIPIGTFCAPVFASICLLPISIDVGVRAALLCYLAVSILAFFLVPDLELVLFFALLLGYYPILHPVLNRIRHRVPRLAAKLLLFNAAVAVIYVLLLFLFTIPEVAEEFTQGSTWLLLAVLAIGNVTFLLYDALIDRMKFIYQCRIRRHLFH